MFVRWLKSLFGRSSPTPPILLRVAEPDGDAPPLLDVETRWMPSGRTLARSVRTADGLCVLHWLADDDRVEITVRSTMGMAVLDHHRSESHGQATRVQLLSTGVSAPSEVLESASSVF